MSQQARELCCHGNFPPSPLFSFLLYNWVPLQPPSIKVWLHGGGQSDEMGDTTIQLYHGENLCRKGVVVVTASYRLGALGFLALPELANDNTLNTTGNWALTDHQQTLRWVAQNAHVFGGDPQRVTLFGQSAGGSLTLSHLTSPLSRGLFSSAIIQSGYIELSHTHSPTPIHPHHHTTHPHLFSQIRYGQNLGYRSKKPIQKPTG